MAPRSYSPQLHGMHTNMSAATLDLVERHRRARELLCRNRSEGAVRRGPSDLPRPQSAPNAKCSSSDTGRVLEATAAANAALLPVGTSAWARPSRQSPQRRRPVSAVTPSRATWMPEGSNDAAPSSNSPGDRRPGPPLPGDSKPQEAGAAEGDFTSEESRLEAEVEQALKELEAADAAMTALRLQLENVQDEVGRSGTELAHLRRVAESWERTVEQGQRELADRQQRIDELLAVLPPDGRQAEAAAVARQEALESQQHDLGEERMRVLTSQTARLEELVAGQQELLRSRMEERGNLEKQNEALSTERDSQRAAQKTARASLRVLESRIKGAEEASSLDAKRRQALERHLVRMRGEANGLRARLASITASKATSVQSRPGAIPSLVAPDLVGNSGTKARHVSLRLQWEIVQLWEALKQTEDRGAR